MLKGLHPEFAGSSNRLFRRYLNDPERLDEDMFFHYNAGNGLRPIRKVMRPRLKQAIEKQDMFSFAVYTTFLPRLMEAYR